jgi:hypothetical protein
MAIATTARPVPSHRSASSLAFAALLTLTASALVADGPFGDAARFDFSGSTWYAEVPHHPELTPATEFTFEAWVQLVTAPDCGSIAGKGYFTSWWIGFCGVGGSLRSYLTASDVALDGGVATVGTWHHIALTYDGSHRRHYIDGVLTAERAEAGPIGTNTSPLRFGSDVNWDVTPDLRLDEARLWDRALTASEINQVLQIAIRSDRPGLIAVWPFDDVSTCATFTADVIGAHDGTCQRTPFIFTNLDAPIILAPDAPAGPWLSTSEIEDFEFKVRITSEVVRIGTKVNDCVPDTLCVAGALPNRTEIALRVIGPRPNGYLWAQGSRFTVSQVEVWVRQQSTDIVQYYLLPGLAPDTPELGGFNDSVAFLP